MTHKRPCGDQPLIQLDCMLQTEADVRSATELRVVALGLSAWRTELIPDDLLIAKLTTECRRPEEGAVVGDEPSTIVIHDMVVLPEGRPTHQLEAVVLTIPVDRGQEAQVLPSEITTQRGDHTLGMLVLIGILSRIKGVGTELFLIVAEL